MSPDDLKKIQGLLPLSQSTIRLNQDCASGVSPADAKPVKGQPLERAASRKEKGRHRADDRAGSGRRARITYVVFARRPADWDNYHIKELQDLLCKAGCLDGDEWDILQGTIISRKVFTVEEERTEVTIDYEH